MRRHTWWKNITSVKFLAIVLGPINFFNDSCGECIRKWILITIIYIDIKIVVQIQFHILRYASTYKLFFKGFKNNLIFSCVYCVTRTFYDHNVKKNYIIFFLYSLFSVLKEIFLVSLQKNIKDYGILFALEMNLFSKYKSRIFVSLQRNQRVGPFRYRSCCLTVEK